jgi:hypothetical protein
MVMVSACQCLAACAEAIEPSCLQCRYKEIMEKAPEEFKEYASCLDNYG